MRRSNLLISKRTAICATWGVHLWFFIGYVWYIISYAQLNFDPTEVWSSFYWWVTTLSLGGILAPISVLLMENFEKYRYLYAIESILLLIITVFYGGMVFIFGSLYLTDCENINICRNPDCIIPASIQCLNASSKADINFIFCFYIYLSSLVICCIYIGFVNWLRTRNDIEYIVDGENGDSFESSEFKPIGSEITNIALAGNIRGGKRD